MCTSSALCFPSGKGSSHACDRNVKFRFAGRRAMNKKNRNKSMDFEHSQKGKVLQKRLIAFMDQHIFPNEQGFFRESEEVEPWKVPPVLEEAREKGKAAGLWNL